LEAELGRDNDLVAERLKCLADEFLILEWTVRLGSIKEFTPRSTAARSNSMASCFSVAGP
jgi:hypothetical protein